MNRRGFLTGGLKLGAGLGLLGVSLPSVATKSSDHDFTTDLGLTKAIESIFYRVDEKSIKAWEYYIDEGCDGSMDGQRVSIPNWPEVAHLESYGRVWATSYGLTVGSEEYLPGLREALWRTIDWTAQAQREMYQGRQVMFWRRLPITSENTERPKFKTTMRLGFFTGRPSKRSEWQGRCDRLEGEELPCR